MSSFTFWLVFRKGFSCVPEWYTMLDFEDYLQREASSSLKGVRAHHFLPVIREAVKVCCRDFK